MAVAPSPSEIFQRAVEEGERRLDQSMLELVATSFIAGFTVVFGTVALGIVHAVVEPQFGELSKIAGALAFGPAIVFLIVGRAELFTENFFDPLAAAFDRSDTWMVPSLARLWGVTFVLNLVGGALMALVFSVDGALPPGTGHALRTTATEIVARRPMAEFADSVAGGVLVTLLSFLLAAADSVGTRASIAYVVGFLLALGPFDHVIVTMLHVLLGLLFGAEIGIGAFLVTTSIVTAGNVVGGLGIGTLTHLAQAKGAEKSTE
ncbi:formate/nitrite transporter family protein [Halalkalicoccus subterraneus]|uniref:formate/nitrite transporter family protein n=1 Tax=Halalkalicoccus subterraneus TaxID=2675002 RepID=UPI000EFCF5B7|nr:formate/nitrite transporter family protein [Halalkalicoccus subterraneus]